ncbi:YbaB/EbfC family nucleoid-associated protein [Patescibacteria group bacterium]|nr:YbaB/EbfC family nucleoid-associated protein [Patescibacteria group bacterium]MBU1890358.1 YbaB/EbfC family nucleoid-associated protein [Patescibacteria group bacterium]
MFQKLKQYKDLRDQAKNIKNQLSEESVAVDENGIHLVMDGNQEVQSITIDPEMFTPEKKDELESSLCKAFNQGVKKVQQIMLEKMRSSGGFNLPGMG